MKIYSNVHTHTAFCDGADSAEKMVKGALAVGCTTLGFSGHSYLGHSSDWAMSREAEEEYVAEVLRLKEKYADRLEILLGIEQDYGSGVPEYDFDFVIGSVHAVMRQGVRIEVDDTPQVLFSGIREAYCGDGMALVRDYYSLVAGVVERTGCDIIGHFDLVTKFNDKHPFVDTKSAEYRELALEALDALIEKNKIFEINTGAISRGWRKTPYPDDFLLRRLAEKKADVMLTSDAHSERNILCGFEDAVEYARSCGIRELCVYNGKKVDKISIK